MFSNENTRVCWGVRSVGSGGRGVQYSVSSPDILLDSVIEWSDNVGWEGAGWGEFCVEEWGGLIEKNYTFEVEGRSVLFGTIETAFHSFNLFISSSSSRQIEDTCSPSLWDITPNALYGIQTYPSNLQLLPASLRSTPLTITTKALSPCKNIGMAKDILLPFVLNWTFLEPIPDGLVNVDPNAWAVGGGGVLNIPYLFLEDRDAFPMNQPVGIQVSYPLFYWHFSSLITCVLIFLFFCPIGDSNL